MKIYVVFGSTGEYSDHREWPVKAFRGKRKAEKLVAAASARASELFIEANNEMESKYSSFNTIEEEKLNQFDPDMEIDYTGVRYYYFEMELE